MSAEQNKRLIKRYFEEGVTAGNLAVFDELCSPDIVNHAAAPDRRVGIAALKDVIRFSLLAQPDQRWTTQFMVAEDELVVVFGVREGTWQATQFRGVTTPTGKKIRVELAHIFRIVDHKIVEHWAVRDDLGMMQQLGALR